MSPDSRSQNPPRSRAPRMPSTPEEERKELMLRRAIAVGAVALVLILLLFAIKGCMSSRQDRGLKDFVKQSEAIVADSDAGGAAFFKLLRDPSNTSATDLQAAVNEQRTQAARYVSRAEKLNAPGSMQAAKRYLIETLELRRDGLAGISPLIAKALSGEDTGQASESIAAQMRYFDASDVIYSQRAYPNMYRALRNAGLPTGGIPISRFLPSIAWLNPTTVDDQLSRARGVSSNAPIAPGLHGTGITVVKVLPSGTVLQSGVDNQLTGVQSIAVDVQNQGENEESNIVVTLVLSGAGTPIKLTDTIDKLAAGDTATVTIPLTRKPAKGVPATLKVDVRRVPGEKNLTNNRQTYAVVFGD